MGGNYSSQPRAVSTTTNVIYGFKSEKSCDIASSKIKENQPTISGADVAISTVCVKQ